jgi:hypothetical protein
MEKRSIEGFTRFITAGVFLNPQATTAIFMIMVLNSRDRWE